MNCGEQELGVYSNKTNLRCPFLPLFYKNKQHAQQGALAVQKYFATTEISTARQVPARPLTVTRARGVGQVLQNFITDCQLSGQHSRRDLKGHENTC